MPRDVPLTLLVDGTVAFGVHAGVAVVVTNLGEWGVEQSERLFAESTALSQQNPHNLIQVFGPPPNARARTRMAELQKDVDRRFPVHAPRRIAVLTSSAVIRGAMTALRWLTGEQLVGFAPADVNAAATWAVGDSQDPAPVAAMHREALARLGFPPGSS